MDVQGKTLSLLFGLLKMTRTFLQCDYCGEEYTNIADKTSHCSTCFGQSFTEIEKPICFDDKGQVFLSRDGELYYRLPHCD